MLFGQIISSITLHIAAIKPYKDTSGIGSTITKYIEGAVALKFPKKCKIYVFTCLRYFRSKVRLKYGLYRSKILQEIQFSKLCCILCFFARIEQSSKKLPSKMAYSS